MVSAETLLAMSDREFTALCNQEHLGFECVTDAVILEQRYEESAQWYRERLVDVGLLDKALKLEGGGVAVPIGGQRRGGYLCSDFEEDAKDTVQQLRGRMGFPSLRIVRGDAYFAWWGYPQPANWDDYRTMGRYFGFSEGAINDYMLRQEYFAVLEQAVGADALEAFLVKRTGVAADNVVYGVATKDLAALASEVGRAMNPNSTSNPNNATLGGLMNEKKLTASSEFMAAFAA